MRFCIVLFYSPIHIKNSDTNSKILMSESYLPMSGTEPFEKKIEIALEISKSSVILSKVTREILLS